MFIFKTSGATYSSVIANQKHAFRQKPRQWKPGELILVSKNKNDCVPGEKQIHYTMRFKTIREAPQEEIESLWPGNKGRWKYIFECDSTELLPSPFNLQDILERVADQFTIYPQ